MRLFPALPVWIYQAPSELQGGMIPGQGMSVAYNIAFAGALVLITIFMIICITGLLVRNYLSKKITGK